MSEADVARSPAVRRELVRYLEHYNFDRAHNGRLTEGRIPAEVLGAAKMYRRGDVSLHLRVGTV